MDGADVLHAARVPPTVGAAVILTKAGSKYPPSDRTPVRTTREAVRARPIGHARCARDSRMRPCRSPATGATCAGPALNHVEGATSWRSGWGRSRLRRTALEGSGAAAPRANPACLAATHGARCLANVTDAKIEG